MFESVFIGYLALLFVSWYVGMFCVSTILKARHPEAFRKFGQPTLTKEILPRLWSQSGDQYLFGFILAREHLELGDDKLSRISDVMFVVFWLFIGTIFLAPLVMVVFTYLL